MAPLMKTYHTKDDEEIVPEVPESTRHKQPAAGPPAQERPPTTPAQGQPPTQSATAPSAPQPPKKPQDMTIEEFRRRHEQQGQQKPATESAPATPTDTPPQWSAAIQDFFEILRNEESQLLSTHPRDNVDRLRSALNTMPQLREWIDNNWQPDTHGVSNDIAIQRDLLGVVRQAEHNPDVLKHLQTAKDEKGLHHLALRLQPRVHSSSAGQWDQRILQERNIRTTTIQPPKNKVLRMPQPGDFWYLRDQHGSIRFITRVGQVQDNGDSWGVTLELGRRSDQHTPDEIEAYNAGYSHTLTNRGAPGHTSNAANWMFGLGRQDAAEGRIPGASAWGVEPDVAERVARWSDPYGRPPTEARSTILHTAKTNGHRLLVRPGGLLDAPLEKLDGAMGHHINVVDAAILRLVGYEWNDYLEENPAAGKDDLRRISKETVDAYLPMGEYASDSLKGLISAGVPGTEKMREVLPILEDVDNTIKKGVINVRKNIGQPSNSTAPDMLVRLAETVRDSGPQVLVELLDNLQRTSRSVYISIEDWVGVQMSRLSFSYIRPAIIHSVIELARTMKRGKAMSWLGSGAGGDLVAPPEWRGPKPDKRAKRAFSLLHKAKALPPFTHGHKPTLAVDLDGTLADTPPHNGPPPAMADLQPRKGAVEAMQELRKLGWQLLLWTARSDYEDIEQWLKKHDIPFDAINVNMDQPVEAIFRVRKDEAKQFLRDAAKADCAVKEGERE